MQIFLLIGMCEQKRLEILYNESNRSAYLETSVGEIFFMN